MSSSLPETNPSGPRLLVAEDNADNLYALTLLLELEGYRNIVVAENGEEALLRLGQEDFDLLLLDVMMPKVDGYQVLEKLKSQGRLDNLPVIMISALNDMDSIVRCINLGAEDYLPKPFDAVLLRARIGASLEKKRLRDQERATHVALQQSQKQLAGELAQAAAYVRAILPEPLSGSIETEWCFQPSQQLGGDTFGYHWIDDDHWAIYLLDVCGHGVGAALLSISALNTIRAQALPNVDFRQPVEVLAA